jgi:hypothetical protein
MLGWLAACEKPASDNSEERRKRRNMAGGNVDGMRVIAKNRLDVREQEKLPI